MDGTSASPQQMNAQQRSAHIREVVLAEGLRLRQQHPWLRHQDALGAGILAFALLGMLGSAALYITGHMAWWVCLLLNAFFASLTHELEHDLIHSMYFRKQRVPDQPLEEEDADLLALLQALAEHPMVASLDMDAHAEGQQIGRASCRERV